MLEPLNIGQEKTLCEEGNLWQKSNRDIDGSCYMYRLHFMLIYSHNVEVLKENWQISVGRGTSVTKACIAWLLKNMSKLKLEILNYLTSYYVKKLKKYIKVYNTFYQIRKKLLMG